MQIAAIPESRPGSVGVRSRGRAGYASLVIARVVDDVFGVVFLCLALMWLAIGMFVLATGRVPARGWFLAGWRRYQPLRASVAMIGIGVFLVMLGADRLNHGRWDLAVLVMLVSMLLVIFVGWLARTWKRANRG